jgi:hypothetical protein
MWGTVGGARQSKYEGVDWGKISFKLTDAELAADRAEKDALVSGLSHLVSGKVHGGSAPIHVRLS